MQCLKPYGDDLKGYFFMRGKLTS